MVSEYFHDLFNICAVCSLQTSCIVGTYRIEAKSSKGIEGASDEAII